MKRVVFALLISAFLHGAVIFLLEQHGLSKPEGIKEQTTTIALVNLGKPNNNESSIQEIFLPSEASQVSNKDFFQTSSNLEPVLETKKPEVKKEVPAVKPMKKSVKKEASTKVKPPAKPVNEQKRELPKSKPPAKTEMKNVATEVISSPAKIPQNDMEGGEKTKPSGSPSTPKAKQNGPQILDTEKAGVNRRVKPVYPRASRLRKEEGKVVLLVEIENRKVISVQIEVSSGYPRLDRSAVDAIKKWTFSYSSRATVRIPVIFRLENQ